MRFACTVRIAGLLLTGVVLSSCGKDPDRPSSLQQQQDAMHTAPPSPDALREAMGKVHFKTPSSNPVQLPPGGAAPKAGR